ncbi:hypothetical protein [Luteolibacter luteus]|uniref:Uncharacterized protein n=1 Tax=Luteolibacter luteus TaxID=2728835 RepID=A0A858RPB4_9BACT|nr:hypothetical protein [Luteolibacter luteus]QJE98857.1 hypothetical protein HHL09_24775 [Luteolibacter luteus]
MIPRPIQHSITYWSGVVTLLFILFAWVASLQKATSISFNTLGRHLSLGHGGSSIIILSVDKRRPSPVPIDQEPMLADRLSTTIPRPSLESRDDGKERTFLAMLPHWLTFIVAAGIWIGLLIWREYRVRKISVGDRQTPGTAAIVHEDLPFQAPNDHHGIK